MVDAKKDERRAFPRIMLRVLVDFEGTDTYLYDYSNDLSEGGIFIETDKPLTVGEELTMRFTLPDIDRVFEAKGAVTWINQVGDGDRPLERYRNGMGIEFQEIDEQDRSLIRTYVEKILKNSD